MRDVAPLSKAFCSAWKSGAPLSPSTVISPSSQAASVGSVANALASAGSLAVQSWPLRVKHCTLPLSMRASRR
jgi:hypothetical protein